MTERRLILVAPAVKENCNHAPALREAFLRDTLSVAARPTLRAEVILASDNPLPQLLETNFARGYQAICVVFGDTPHLPEAYCIEAFGRLSKGAEVVLGPADGGDCYLLALRAPLPALLNGVSWQGDSVETLLQRASENQIAVSLLPPLYTVRDALSLQRLRTDLARNTSIACTTKNFLEIGSSRL